MRRSRAPKLPRLSAREQEVLELLAEGLGTAEIAGRLFMSESTTKTHISHIYDKLDAANRAQALVTAMREGLLDRVSTRPF
jgi:DNA-binding NarL/FixJ family response regulator